MVRWGLGAALAAVWVGSGAGTGAAQGVRPADPLQGLRVEACVFGGELQVVTLVEREGGWLARSPWHGAAVVPGTGGGLTLVDGERVLQIAGPASALIVGGVPSTGSCETITELVRGAGRAAIEQAIAETPDAILGEIERRHQGELAAVREAAAQEIADLRAQHDEEMRMAAEARRAQFAALTADLANARTRLSQAQARAAALAACSADAHRHIMLARGALLRIARGTVQVDDVPIVAAEAVRRIADHNANCPADEAMP